MQTEWDPAKAEENRREHGVDFADAVPVLSDPFALSREDVQAQGEQRFVALGMDRLGRILVVAYTYRGPPLREYSSLQGKSQSSGIEVAASVHIMRASAASARETQKLMSRARYSARVLDSSAQACSHWPILV